MSPIFFRALLLFFALLSGSLVSAAEKHELVNDAELLRQAQKHQGKDSANFRAMFGLTQQEDLKELRSVTDKNGVTHTRYRQTSQGIPVWGEHVIISRDRSGNVVRLHGRLVKNLADELPPLQPALTSKDALNAMKDKVSKNFSQDKGLSFKNEVSELVVYLDGDTPKLSYSVSFFADTQNGGQPTRPYYIVDAVSGDILFQYEGLTHAASSLLNVTNITGSLRTWQYYTVTVPAGQAALFVTTAGSNGDADLYLRFGSQPTTTTNDCASGGSNSNESCVVNSPAAGTWHIGVYAFSAYNGLTLSAKVFDTYDDGIGPGGNVKTNPTVPYYYGTEFPPFEVLKDNTTCTMNGVNVKTVNLNHGTSGSNAYTYTDASGLCLNTNNTTGGLTINGAYAPLNDAHYFGRVVYDMYNDWVGVAPLTFQLAMKVHYSTNYENAFWDGSSMTFGDGFTFFYPLVSLDVSAHEVSHGFTEQNSALIYSGESGGINEAYSDIAGEAAENYMRGSNDLLVGAEIIKDPDGALRYMCNPPLDGVSIGSANDYYNGLDVHYSSGVFNKAFCLLAQTDGWNTQTAFQAFAQANQFYWTPSATFISAARGVYDAACGLGFDTNAVINAFAGVDVAIDTSTNPCVVDGDTPPVVSVTAPSNNATVSGNAVTVSANASDDLGVVGVEFFVDGVSIGTGLENSGVWSVTWDSASVGDGIHAITSVATDTIGQTTTSGAINVTVDNVFDTLHIGNLTGTSTLGSRGRWNAKITVDVHDANHSLLANATASGTWSSGASGSGSCVTNASGQCSITKSGLRSTVLSATFTVNNVTHSSLTYDAVANDVSVSKVVSKP